MVLKAQYVIWLFIGYDSLLVFKFYQVKDGYK